MLENDYAIGPLTKAEWEEQAIDYLMSQNQPWSKKKPKVEAVQAVADRHEL